LSHDVFRRGEFKVFSLRTTNFSSEAGEVLTFFAYFFASRQKSKWGLGQSPMFNMLIYNSIYVYP